MITYKKSIKTPFLVEQFFLLAHDVELSDNIKILLAFIIPEFIYTSKEGFLIYCLDVIYTLKIA